VTASGARGSPAWAAEEPAGPELGVARASRAQAVVDLGAIRENVRRLRAVTGVDVMAVVKADGYGHGLLPAARAAVRGGASWLGVAFVEEALALRTAGIDVPILCLLAAPGERFAEAIAADVDLAVSAEWALSEVCRAATTAGRAARIHLEVDTGLSRGGATPAEWPDLLAATAQARAAGLVEVVGIWSHLVHGDNPEHADTTVQVERFDEALAVAERFGIRPAVRHLANSGGALLAPRTRYDLVRPGIAVYGLSPAPALVSAGELGLRPAMHLRAEVALVKELPAGEGISYGHRYRTSRPTRVALIPLGYADGIPRQASNVAPVWFPAVGRRTISGTVCMDQFVVDVGPDAPVAAGDDVVIFGPGDDGEPTADEWASAVGTISYEIVSRIGARVPRVYRDDDTAG
jgi:alanine racemase